LASTSNQNAAQAVIEKQQRLLENLGALESLIVALSGGADSAYLAWAAHRALGPRALSVTALSASYSAYDREQAESFLRATGVHHEFVETHELEDPRYRANNADRCYYCKHELFSVLDRLAHKRNFAALAYGINADDTSDFRPGHRAAGEHRVLTPLLDVDLHKTEIRALSRQAGLPTWDRPASACLSSRVAYGIQVTPEILRRVEDAEAALRKLGFRQFRVRVHGDLARIEIATEEMPRALTPETARTMAESLKHAGFAYVTLDLQGYRHGSMNEILSK
jgi:pyridinium-3,5-biscarboxylic acid mononucleotide sulfurtransferase